ncbi:MAG: hypothetical protein VX278_18780 [Myxococcota bacterium]|nr:hypothetical protein [Myxococcota bacterium]
MPIPSLLSLLLSSSLFFLLTYQAWYGKLGFLSIIVLPLCILLFLYARKSLALRPKKWLSFLAKLLFTIVGILALLRHPIETDVQIVDEGTAEIHVASRADAPQTTQLEIFSLDQKASLSLEIPPKRSVHTVSVALPDGEYRVRIQEETIRPTNKQPIYRAIVLYIDQVDRNTFILFAFLAMLIKFFGVMSSAYAWHLLLKGQRIEQPYWSATLTAFLIGRFIGTFLPSTIGLDSYTFYEASRYSNQITRVGVAKILEKFIGITGLFIGMVITLPFGYQVIVDVAEKLNKPESASVMATAILVCAGGVSASVILGLVKPQLFLSLTKPVTRLFPQRVQKKLIDFTDAVAAYDGQLTLITMTLIAKFLTHFTTAVVYFFTAIAIGAIAISMTEFWPIVFGSNIQILATILSPTIAGEGAREAFQALLLEKRLGGVPQAVLSGSLGFVAAEAATMWGGAFWLTRKETWRPKFVLVDGQQVDYSWLSDVKIEKPTAK